MPQLIDSSGNLVENPGSLGIRVTYEAVADPSQSINKTSVGKSNFWTFVDSFFGTSLAPDTGLTGNRMPGLGNVPQEMTFDSQYDFFKAEGIPITPYDDTGAKNYYPMMRLTAWNSSNQVLAVTDIVLPVSDEMDCRLCHASGGSSEARPGSGWVSDPDPERDYRLNILLLHDERRGSSLDYANALSQLGYNPDGLFDNAATDGNPILCASCHRSNALPGTGVSGIPPLTQSVHSYHAGVEDPLTSQILENSENRQSCYRCHPGSETRCLRGVMGRAVALDGSMAIQCQDCHGSMSKVGSATREGWFDEPTCQNCHTGTALNNNGQIRYLSAFENSGNLRVAVNHTFATNSNTPAPGVSLYRFLQDMEDCNARDVTVQPMPSIRLPMKTIMFRALCSRVTWEQSGSVSPVTAKIRRLKTAGRTECIQWASSGSKGIRTRLKKAENSSAETATEQTTGAQCCPVLSRAGP